MTKSDDDDVHEITEAEAAQLKPFDCYPDCICMPDAAATPKGEIVDPTVQYGTDQLPPAYEAALGMVPLIVSVPAEEIDGLRPGNPVYDAMAEYARRERPGAGFMVVPQELVYDPIPIVQNLPEIPIDLVYDSISTHQNLSYSIIEAPCTVCGGNGCDMSFCYVTGK